jgi:hypothetical protein
MSAVRESALAVRVSVAAGSVAAGLLTALIVTELPGERRAPPLGVATTSAPLEVHAPSLSQAPSLSPSPAGAHTAEAERALPAAAVELPELTAAVAAARAAQGCGDEGVAEEAARERGRLVQRLLLDPPALARALQEFRQARGDTAELLAAALGQVRDREVEATALELAAHGASAELRAAAFDVLDALDSAQALEVALSAIAREVAPEVRRAALFALPDAAGATIASASHAVRELTPRVSDDPDPESRRRAALALARWHTSLDELQPLISALAGDPDPSVRAGAAFGLERCGRRHERVAAALADAVRRPGEAREVRETAWQALGAQGALGPREAAAHADYAREREGWLEGE